ncbi:MAG: hypothetical protein K0R54_583 [Clostridiaceae bacterium]|jgi:hypothetical protein|nr:hypothetical protein [Clostridiaceae bacterium]
MKIEKKNKEAVDILFENGYGIVKIGNIAFTKTYKSYKFMIKELFFTLIGLPLIIIKWVIELTEKLMNLIPNVKIIKSQ